MATTTTELIEETRGARGRKMRTTQERDAYVQAYRTSGLTQKAFAKRGGRMGLGRCLLFLAFNALPPINLSRRSGHRHPRRFALIR